GPPGGTSPIDITTSGDQLGMPEYRAPEQARDARKVDVRADLYSLGCIFYHMLVGQPPFVDKNPIRLVLRHATEAPLPRAGCRLGEPAGLQLVLDGLLAKDPALRIPTPAQAAQQLRPFVAGVTGADAREKSKAAPRE